MATARLDADRRSKKRRTSLWNAKWLRKWMFMLPALGFLAVFFVYPFWGLVLRSLNFDGDFRFDVGNFTWFHYREAFGDSTYWVMFRSTIHLALVSTIITTALAYPVAYFMVRAPRRILRLSLVLVMFPYCTSILIRLYAFTQILAPMGLLHTTVGAEIGMVAYLLPYMIVMLYAAMTSIDTGLGPAARTLGAGPWQVFTKIFFPLSRAGLISGVLFIFVVSLGFYITPSVLGSTTNVALSTYIQQQVDLYRWGVASAMGIVLLIITLIIFAVSNRLTSAGSSVPVATQKGLSRTQEFRWTRTNVVLGLWTVASLTFLLMPLIVTVVTSFDSRSYLDFPPENLSLRWYRAVFEDPTWFNAAWLSLRVGLFSAAVATGLALAAAFGLERSGIKRKGLIRTLIYVPLIVPVVLVGAALFGFEVEIRINGTVLGYVIGHVLHTLPVAMVILTTAIQGTSVRNEDAARTLGANPWTAFWRITFPSIAPSVGATFAMCLLVSWDEPVISLFLSTTDQTLPVKYLLFLQDQILPTMAAVGTLLMAAVITSYLVLMQGGRLATRLLRKRLARKEQYT